MCSFHLKHPRVNAFFLNLTDVPQHQPTPTSTCNSFTGVVFDKQRVISGVASLSLTSDGCSCSGKMTEVAVTDVAVIATIVW